MEFGKEVTMTERAGEQIGRTGTAVKRRGILAAAGVAVAGLVAKQAAQPVAAIAGGGDEGALVLASNPWYKVTGDHSNTPNQSSIGPLLQATPNFQNYIGFNGVEAVVLKVDASTAGGGNIDGVEGYGKGTGSGVYGYSATGRGVYGRSDGFHAVFGLLTAPAGSGMAGVFGQGSGAGTYGVRGNN